jgi:hypothetical protein
MNETNAKILRNVRDAEAFYFSRAFGSFTGQKANSLEEFFQKIKEVDARCLEFHLTRKDFEKWVEFTIGDFRLASDLRALRRQKLIGENLRKHFSLIVSKRLNELLSLSEISEDKGTAKKSMPPGAQLRIQESRALMRICSDYL